MNEFLFIFSYKYNGKIGIIDTYINNTYDNLTIYESEYKNNEYKETHGDSLISFLNSLEYNNEIYYYEAVNEDGKIKSENIIAGLEWIKKIMFHELILV